MIEYLKPLANEGKEINAKDMLTTYNLDVICSAGFGIEANSFADPDNKLTEMVWKFHMVNMCIKTIAKTFR